MSFLSLVSSAARTAAAITACIAASSADDEREDEPEQGQGLDEPDADEHGPPDHAGGLGLSSHGLHGLAHQDADADSRADGGQAVHQSFPDRGEAPGGPAGLSDQADQVR